MAVRSENPDEPRAPKDPGSVRFAALDFETADCGRDSACALSVVVVAGNRLERQETFLIRPPRRQFVFTYIHGITWQQVADKPDFKNSWPGIQPLLEGVDLLAAHNASFDRSVLAACCAMAGVAGPSLPFLCTVKLARRAWGLKPANLPAVCRHLHLELRHHDAASDALACARIVMAAVREGFDLQTIVPGFRIPAPTAP
jgi:DNA polymerase-3 subunit epsilon